MSDAEPEVMPPAIRTSADGNSRRVTIQIPAPNLPRGSKVRCALSAVLENDDGELSYWALHHPAATPDFHHPAGFVMELELKCTSV